MNNGSPALGPIHADRIEQTTFSPALSTAVLRSQMRRHARLATARNEVKKVRVVQLAQPATHFSANTRRICYF